MEAFLCSSLLHSTATCADSRAGCHSYHGVERLVMMNHLFNQTRWRMASVFAVILLAMSTVMGSFVYSTYQKASADYTKLVSSIFLAQQATPQLQLALEEGSRHPNGEQIRYIGYFLTLSHQHLNNIRTSIDHHRHLNADIDNLHKHFIKLDHGLTQLHRQAQESTQRPELIEEVQQAAIEIGHYQMWLYEQLLEKIQAVSAQQRLVMQRLTLGVSVLLVLVVSATITLCMEVIHLHHQRRLMHQMMLTDELTGLYNRRHLVNVASGALKQAQRDQAPLSLMLLDLDYFKRINDTYGHPIGDEVLRQISKKLRQLSRPTDTLARIGGEEFCLLMPNTSTHDALQVADRLRREVEANQLSGLEADDNPTISIGVTTDISGTLNFEQLYSFADKALYKAKSLGRNRVESLLPTITSPAPLGKPSFRSLLNHASDSLSAPE